MALWILRSVFLVVAAGLGVFLSTSQPSGANAPSPWLTFLAVMVGALAVIGVDVALRQKRIDMISCVYFGIVVGLFLTLLLGLAVKPILNNWNIDEFQFQLVTATFLCYVCISMLIQTKDDFRFIIPYVEFAKEVKGLRPYILDTSAIIDGRIADVVDTHVLDNQLIMPRFVLNELQAVADSGDRLRRARGRRGLDVLNRLRGNKDVDLKIYDRDWPEMAGQPVDMKLVMLAKRLDGKLVTGDYNLNKVARLHNVPVVNLNDLANALKPLFLPSEQIEVKLVKPGEEDSQGVGYLDDGTMIVVEGGRERIGRDVRIEVTSVLQTSAGRMIFGRYLQEIGEGVSRQPTGENSAPPQRRSHRQ